MPQFVNYVDPKVLYKVWSTQNNRKTKPKPWHLMHFRNPYQELYWKKKNFIIYWKPHRGNWNLNITFRICHWHFKWLQSSLDEPDTSALFPLQHSELPHCLYFSDGSRFTNIRLVDLIIDYWIFCATIVLKNIPMFSVLMWWCPCNHVLFMYLRSCKQRVALPITQKKVLYGPQTDLIGLELWLNPYSERLGKQIKHFTEPLKGHG